MSKKDAQLTRLCQYIRNTGQKPLAIADFDDDQSPVGPTLRGWLREAGLIEEQDGGILLTQLGERRQ